MINNLKIILIVHAQYMCSSCIAAEDLTLN